MAPTTKKAAPKKASTSSHASYQDMIKEAIINLKERSGSSRQKIKKYIQANNSLGATTDAQFSSHINRALAAGEASGEFLRPKGPSGPVKLAKKEAKPAASKTSPPATKEKKETTKKATTTKKTATKKEGAATTKKATTTKKAPATKKETTKKAAAKPKANASKPRKTAPAVEDKAAVVLGKTKSGRVTKTKAPQTKAKATTKKTAAPKKAATKKSTPKKSEAAASA